MHVEQHMCNEVQEATNAETALACIKELVCTRRPCARAAHARIGTTCVGTSHACTEGGSRHVMKRTQLQLLRQILPAQREGSALGSLVIEQLL